MTPICRTSDGPTDPRSPGHPKSELLDRYIQVDGFCRFGDESAVATPRRTGRTRPTTIQPEFLGTAHQQPTRLNALSLTTTEPRFSTSPTAREPRRSLALCTGLELFRGSAPARPRPPVVYIALTRLVFMGGADTQDPASSRECAAVFSTTPPSTRPGGETKKAGSWVRLRALKTGIYLLSCSRVSVIPPRISQHTNRSGRGLGQTGSFQKGGDEALGDITPVMAATAALWALDTLPEPSEPAPFFVY